MLCCPGCLFIHRRWTKLENILLLWMKRKLSDVSAMITTIPLPNLFCKADTELSNAHQQEEIPLKLPTSNDNARIIHTTSNLTLDKFPHIHLILFQNVTNSKELKKLIISGDDSIPQSIMLNPACVSLKIHCLYLF